MYIYTYGGEWRTRDKIREKGSKKEKERLTGEERKRKRQRQDEQAVKTERDIMRGGENRFLLAKRKNAGSNVGWLPLGGSLKS